MAFQQMNSGFNNNGGDKKKANFKLTKIDTDDGRLTMTVWKSDRGGIYLVMSIARVAGKDPSTGRTLYEQKMPNELPSIYMDREAALAFYHSIKAQNINDTATAKFQIKSRRGDTVSAEPRDGGLYFQIENTKVGTAGMTFKAVPVGNGVVHANWNVLQRMTAKAVDKLMYDKLDPDEFNVSGASDMDDENSPF